jgi:hypothetical protein
MERLTLVVENKGRLLKADRIGGDGAGLAAGFLLTFDVGRLLLEVEPNAGMVRSLVIEGAEEIPAGVLDASADEPWWRLVGSPLARVSAGEVGAQGLRLQFRADHENPRFITLQPSGSEVQVTLEPVPES